MIRRAEVLRDEQGGQLPLLKQAQAQRCSSQAHAGSVTSDNRIP